MPPKFVWRVYIWPSGLITAKCGRICSSVRKVFSSETSDLTQVNKASASGKRSVRLLGGYRSTKTRLQAAAPSTAASAAADQAWGCARLTRQRVVYTFTNVHECGSNDKIWRLKMNR